MKYTARTRNNEFIIEIGQDGQVAINGELFDIDFQQIPGSGVASLLLDNRSLEAVVEERNGHWEVLIKGELYTVTVDDERTQRLAQARGSIAALDGEVIVKSPMPGIIVAVPVNRGDSVCKGDKVVILESMKMENELRAPMDGIITQIRVQAGDNVEKDQFLLAISNEEPA
jgi:biotin carboxyl carrier protein